MGRRRTMLRCEPVRRPKQWIRLLALLALVAFVLPTVLASRALFFCRMSGQVMHACCCAGHEQARPPLGMQLKGTDCCQRLQQAAKAPAPRFLCGNGLFRLLHGEFVLGQLAFHSAQLQGQGGQFVLQVMHLHVDCLKANQQL